jgi:PTH2 family peptidyl-tRNA hydrolase
MDKPVDEWTAEDGSRVKAWFIMRTDIEMSPGKLAVQVGHGTDFIHMLGDRNPYYTFWMHAQGGNRRKIVLRGDIDHILKVKAACEEVGMVCHLIGDAGLTEFNGPTVTGMCICPHNDAFAPKILKRTQAWKPKSTA